MRLPCLDKSGHLMSHLSGENPRKEQVHLHLNPLPSSERKSPQANDVVRGFSLVPHDPEGSYYNNLEDSVSWVLRANPKSQAPNTITSRQ